MKNYKHLNNVNSQKGFAVLAVSMIMLFIITINVFVAAKGSIIEQQTSTNSYIYEVALNNAEAGVAAMFKQLANGVVSPPVIIGNDSNSKQIYKVTYKSPYITSVGNGISGSSTTQRAVIQRVIPFQPGVLTNAPAAINTLGKVDLTANYTTTSINSGGAVSGNRNNGGVLAENSPTFRVNITSNNGSILLDDFRNPITRPMSPDEFFMFFYGSTFCSQANANLTPSQCTSEAKQFIANSQKGIICDNNCGSQFLTQYRDGKRFFWVTNGLSINPSSGISETTPLGSESDPVYIFIMDNSELKFNGNSIINGVIYIHTPATTYSCTCQAKYSVSSFSNGSILWAALSNSLSRSGNPSQCTDSSCSEASNICKPSNIQTVLTKVGDSSTCNYQTPAINVVTGGSGNSGDVVIQVLNDSSFIGTGTSQIKGALITSGNIIKTAGGGSVVAPFGGNSTLVGTPIALHPKGWTDIVQ